MSDNQWLEDAKQAIITSSPDSSVYVGTDSIRYKKDGVWMARYSTVVVVHMDSSKGCKLFFNSESMPDYGNLKQRLLNEVMFAISTCMEIVDILGGRHLEIHLDLNPSPNHKSNVAVKEALGYVRGQLGFNPMIKPNAWAATHAADHAVRGKIH